MNTDWPTVGPCGLRNATWVAGAESGPAPLAHAWLHSPTNSVMVTTAAEIRTKGSSCLRDLTMSVSLLYFEQSLPGDWAVDLLWIQWGRQPCILRRIFGFPRGSDV